MVMGDLVLTEDEIEPVMLKLQQNGIEQTSIHNHLGGKPHRRVNSIKASSVVKRAPRGSAVRMRSVSKKITSQAFQYRQGIRTRCLLGCGAVAKRSAKLDLSKFEDGYEVALKELVDAKINHLPMPQDKGGQPRRGNVVNLMDALRKSLGSAAAPVGRSTKKPAASVRPEPKKGIGLVKSAAKSVAKRKSAYPTSHRDLSPHAPHYAASSRCVGTSAAVG
jgi:hypothetical protein